MVILHYMYKKVIAVITPPPNPAIDANHNGG